MSFALVCSLGFSRQILSVLGEPVKVSLLDKLLRCWTLESPFFFVNGLRAKHHNLLCHPDGFWADLCNQCSVQIFVICNVSSVSDISACCVVRTHGEK